jgi:hypothetical protein
VRSEQNKLVKDRIIIWIGDPPSNPLFVKMTGVSELHPDGDGWTLAERLSKHSILDAEQTEAFFSRDVDHRYQELVRIWI